MDCFENKTYVVIGASSGIGGTLSKMLLEKGAETWLVSRSKDNIINLLAVFPNAHFLQCDLLVSDDIERLGAFFLSNDVKLDGLVFCAGVSPLMKIEDTDVNVLKDSFQTNVISFIEIMKWFALEAISKTGSSVVVMSSIAANIASFRQTVYASTKAALEEAVRCISKELIDRRIRINAIAAGAVNTPMLTKLMEQSDTLRTKLEKLYPLGLISPEQISNQILYLLSDFGANTTGTVINLDSGFLSYK